MLLGAAVGVNPACEQPSGDACRDSVWALWVNGSNWPIHTLFWRLYGPVGFLQHPSGCVHGPVGQRGRQRGSPATPKWNRTLSADYAKL